MQVEPGAYFTWSRQQKRDIIKLLRAQGLTTTQVASVLGCSRTAVGNILSDPDGSKQRKRRERYREPCPDCGKPMDGSGGWNGKRPERCAACAKEHQRLTREWTPGTVVAAIQRFARQHGRPPSAEEWISTGLYEDDEGWYKTPPRSAIYGHHYPEPNFRSWGAAIEAAGFPYPRVGKHARVGTVGLGPSQWVVLELLERHGQLDTGEIADILGVQRTTAYAVLASLRRRQLIRSERATGGRYPQRNPSLWSLSQRQLAEPEVSEPPPSGTKSQE